MADTSQSEQTPPIEPQTNGVGDGMDEEDRNKMRPADIDADMREMERRKRVEMIMNSRLFREELERIIETQLKDGNGPAGLLQQLSDMMGMQGGRLQPGSVFRGSNCVIPINDIRGVESMGYAKGEKILRCKLAAVYRLMDLCGWTQGIYNHITARLNQDQEHFLINPFGMLYHEITASSLVKIDMQGTIVESGTTNFGVNVAGFMLHSAIHAARPDIKCIIHVHTPAVLAVSSLKCGLLPLCQEAIVIGEVSNHPYLGGILEPEERDKIARNLGPVNKVMFLANHGAVCCGETVEEAFYNVYNTVLACETQVKVMPMGLENLVLISDETRKQVYEAARRPPDSVHRQEAGSELPPSGIKKEKQWRIGGTEFEALMRMLDNAGFRTGYIYRHPLVKGEPPRPRNDVEVPPAVSSLGYLLEEEEMYKQGQWKKYIDGRKTHDRTRWLNSPNVYQKVEILETGTPDPKKITKWVADGSPTHTSTPVKIDSALQFVPKNTNPKEFKKLQQQIKDNRRADKITSGPQSHILEGVSWEEAKKLQDANISATGDQVILVGAASKGIIQRGFQHNALVYKTPYAKNPFDTVTDEELEEYKKVVERKQRGESFDEDQSESEPLSSSLQNNRPMKEGAHRSPLMSPTSAASETEEESRDEPRVLRIETKQVPRPSQAEVVLSDAESDLPDPNVERSMSLRLPAKVADSSEVPNEFKRSWSMGPNKQIGKDEGIQTEAGIANANYRRKFYCSHDSFETYIVRYSVVAQRMTVVIVDLPLYNLDEVLDNNRATSSDLPLYFNSNLKPNHNQLTKKDTETLLKNIDYDSSKKYTSQFGLMSHNVNCILFKKKSEIAVQDQMGAVAQTWKGSILYSPKEKKNIFKLCPSTIEQKLHVADSDTFSSSDSLNSFFIEENNLSDSNFTDAGTQYNEIEMLILPESQQQKSSGKDLICFKAQNYILYYSITDSDSSVELCDLDDDLDSNVTDNLQYFRSVDDNTIAVYQSNIRIRPGSAESSYAKTVKSRAENSSCINKYERDEMKIEDCREVKPGGKNACSDESKCCLCSKNGRHMVNFCGNCSKTEICATKQLEKYVKTITDEDKHMVMSLSTNIDDRKNKSYSEITEIDTYFCDENYCFAIISAECKTFSENAVIPDEESCKVLQIPEGIVLDFEFKKYPVLSEFSVNRLFCKKQ